MADNFKFVQAQPFSLAGAGAIIGATSVVLKSFAGIDGTLLTMTDFGTIGYGTLEPGNGTLEEQISFTGVTQNANGTATLTGVKTVLFIAPYTETSGLAKTHAGSTQFVISNTSGFYDKLTSKDDDETIIGKWTFPGGGTANAPVSGASYTAPTNNLEYASKQYVDSVAIAGAPVASTTILGIVEVSVNPVNPLIPIAVGDNDGRVPTQGENDALAGNNGTPGSSNTYVTQLGFQRGQEIYAADSQASDTYVITLSPAPAAYVTGMLIRFKANTANTGAATLNVNGLGAVTIVKGVSTTLADNDILASQFVVVEYNGTNFVLMNPVGLNREIKFKVGNTTHDMSSTTTTVIAHGLGVTPKLVRLHINKAIADASGITGSIVSSLGSYDGSTQNSNYVAVSTNGATSMSDIDTSNAVHYGYGNTAGANSDRLVGSASIDATNITITWTKTNSPVGTANIIWEAIG